METQTILEKDNKINRYINMAIYLLPFIYIDRYGAIIVISAIAFANFYKSEHNDAAIYEYTNKKRNKYILLTAVIYILGFIFNYSVHYFNYQLKIKGIIFIPSYAVAYFVFVPLGYYLKENKSKLKELFSINKSIIRYTALLCLPLGILCILEGSFQSVDLYSREALIQKIFQAIFIAALTEELFFRGLIYGLMKRFLKVETAQVLSAFMFSIYHTTLLKQIFDFQGILPLMNLMSIFLLGIAACKVVEKTKSLIPGIVFHALVDGALTSLIILFRLTI